MLTKQTRQIGWIAALGVVLSLAAGRAGAQGVVNPGGLPQLIPINSSNVWEIGNAANPIPVALDPNGNQPWAKKLGDQNGQPFGPNSNPLLIPGTLYTLHEYILVSGTNPWTDWHEDILDPTFSWQSASLQVIFGTPILPPAPVGLGTTGVSFFFPPVAPGSIIEITKQFSYFSPVIFQGYVPVNEYPTGLPEPTSILLIGSAGAFLLKRPRRSLVAAN